MPSRLLRSLAIACGGLLVGCGLEVRTSRTSTLTASAFEGEWVGSWVPAAGAGADTGGPLTVRLQTFAGAPVLAVDIDNPCIVPRDYELVLQPPRIELRADGQVVFGAALQPDRTLLGTWQCTAGTGTWTAVRQRALPPIVDLSGTWLGALLVPGGAQFVLELDLQQRVRTGALVLEGQLALPELLPVPVAVAGSVRFRDGAFDLLLQNTAGAPIDLIVSGIGQLDPARLQPGLVQFFGPTPLPFTQGVVRIERQTPP